MAGFWNAIGLPNAADIQNLTELCRQQAQRIETLENEVLQMQKAVQTQAEQDNAREQTKKNAVVLRKNTMLHQQTQEKLTESAKNQDELLRILIVNSLGDELEKDIAEPKAKSSRKK